MSIALDEDLQQLADAVARLCRRQATMERTREQLDALAAGAAGSCWQHLVAQGLHAIHLPGGGGGLPEVAVVAEQLGRSLAPGPWLPTILASAALSLAHPDDTTFADGATGALVLQGITATAVEAGWHLTGTSAPTLGLPGADVVLVRADGHLFRVQGTTLPAEGSDSTRSVGTFCVI